MGEGLYSCLWLKIVNQEEWTVLNGFCQVHLRRWSWEELIIFLARSPPVLSSDKHAYGIPVSIWGRDPKLTKLTLSYEFVNCLWFGLWHQQRF
jgi:hypothetical protein